jgi:chitinase
MNIIPKILKKMRFPKKRYPIFFTWKETCFGFWGKEEKFIHIRKEGVISVFNCIIGRFNQIRKSQIQLKFITVLLFSSVFFSNCKCKYSEMDNQRVIAYYSNFEGKRPVDGIRFDGLTHINLAFLYVCDTSVIKHHEYNKLLNDSTIQKLSQYSGKNGVKAYISLGGSASHFVAIAKDSVKLDSLSRFVGHFCSQHNFSGLDLDWETPGNENENMLYTHFVKTLSAALRRDSLGFSITLPGQYDKTKTLDYDTLLDYVDWINLMFYDYGNVNTSLFLPNTPLDIIKNDLDSFLNIIPAERIVAGIAAYGYDYIDVKGHNIGDSAKRLNVPLLMDSIFEKAKNVSTWRYHFWETARVPVLINEKEFRIITYDDIYSIREKCDVFVGNGISGVMFWNIFYDSEDWEQTIQKAIMNYFEK